MEILPPISPRRKDVRKHMPPSPRAWVEWLHRRDISWALFYAFALAFFAGAIAIAAQNRPPYSAGQIVPNTITARVAFKSPDAIATANARRDARDREPSVYTPNPVFAEFLRDQFKYLGQIATKVPSFDQLPDQFKNTLTSADFDAIKSDWFVEQTNKEVKQTNMLDGMRESFEEDLWDIAVLDAERAPIEQQARKIVIRNPSGNAKDVFPNEIYGVQADPGKIDSKLRDRIADKARVPFGRQGPAITMLVMKAFNSSDAIPTYIYDAATTEKLRQDRYASVDNRRYTSFARDAVIVFAGERLSAEDVERLAYERAAYLDSSAKWQPIRAAGLAGLVTIIAASIWAYIFAYNRRIATNSLRGLALTGLLLLGQGAAVWATMSFPRLAYLTAPVPTLITGIVIAIVYDRRFAMAVGSLHTLLVLVTLNLAPEHAFVMLVGVVVAVAQLDEVRTRSKLLLTGIASGTAMGFTVIVAGFAMRRLDVNDTLFSQVFRDAGWALFAGVGSGMLVQALLPAIEKVFRVTTSMTLTELNDGTLPLLRRLAQEAPGTYQHSLRISDMAEAAAREIDADSLLCKVGAMYHDIGKINKPGYFVENQAGGPNRHDKLPPSMSLLIIVGHVKDGIEMAREYRLPPSIRQFIETHHGTTLVEYFYHAAKQQHAGEPGAAPSEFEYRYPGPKPQTREAAILMLCDGVEAAARTMHEPSAMKFEQLVHRMAQTRLTDGQFDECSITLQELHKIEQSIVKTLTAMYHVRIAYPSDEIVGNTASAAS